MCGAINGGRPPFKSGMTNPTLRLMPSAITVPQLLLGPQYGGRSTCFRHVDALSS
jgi:hypothetical protein